MTIAQQLQELCLKTGSAHPLPPISQILIAPLSDEPGKSSKFGAMILDDGTVGITYVGLDDGLKQLHQQLQHQSYSGMSPLKIAALYIGSEPWQRVLGMAAVNAISQWYFHQKKIPLAKMPPLLEALEIKASDHLGMVGYYPPLVERLKDKCRLTVLELDPSWLQAEQSVEITLEPQRIESCNKIISTGTTLINHSLDSILDHCSDDATICVMGPTSGCLPDPLFKRGVTHLAGSRVNDTQIFIERWSSGEPWREATSKYLISREDYQPI